MNQQQPAVEHPDIKGMTAEERMAAVLRTSITSPDHLKRWLEQSGRRWLVLDSVQLVEALPWPDGVSALAQILAALRDHRFAIPTGEFETQYDSEKKCDVRVPLHHTEQLEVCELDRAIRYLIGQITEKDSAWSLENQPL
jgi:hypothetical protein